MGITNKQTLFSLAVIAALGVAISSPAIAGKPGSGPQVSANADTACAVDGTGFRVTTKVLNKHVGEKAGDPVVTRWEVTAYAKTGPGKWFTNGNTESIGSFLAIWDPSDPTAPRLEENMIKQFEMEAPFDLCQIVNTPDLNGLGLNVMAEVRFQPANDPAGEKVLTNACGDDPYTADVVEPNGIKLDAADVAAIQALCP